MKEQLIELAKEKGFDWCTLYAYDAVPILCSHASTVFDIKNYNSESGGDYCSAPAQEVLQKWLRDTYNIHTEIRASNSGQYFVGYIRPGEQPVASVKYLRDETDAGGEVYYYDTYEIALEALLLEILKTL